MTDSSKVAPQYYQLLSHPFTLIALQNEKKAIDFLSEQNRINRANPKAIIVITPEFAYYDGVFHYLNNIINTIGRIEQIPVFLRRFPSSKFFNDNNVTLHKWVNYHYANYLIMSTSLYDISLLLTNEVFRLGFDPRDCTYKNVGKHEAVKKTVVKPALDKLDQVVKEFRDPRNFFAHRGSNPALGFMDDLDSYIALNEMEKELGLEQNTADLPVILSSPTLLRDMYRVERRKLVVQIEQKIDLFVDVIKEVFSAQQIIYAGTTAQFSS